MAVESILSNRVLGTTHATCGAHTVSNLYSRGSVLINDPEYATQYTTILCVTYCIPLKLRLSHMLSFPIGTQLRQSAIANKWYMVCSNIDEASRITTNIYP